MIYRNTEIIQKKRRKKKIRRQPVAGERLDPLAWRLASISPPLKGRTRRDAKGEIPREVRRDDDRSIREEERETWLEDRLIASCHVKFEMHLDL